MKRLILLAGGILLLFPAAMAQTPDSPAGAAEEPTGVEIRDRAEVGIDSLRRIDAVESDLIRMHGSGDSVVLEVAGFGLTLGRTYMQRNFEQMSRKRFWLGAVSSMEMGFTLLTGIDYRGYAAGQRGFLDQRLGPSFHFSFTVVNLGMALNRSHSWQLNLGLQYTLDNIRLSDNTITLDNEAGRLVPVVLESPADKSKIVYSSLGIPLRANWFPVKRLCVSAVAYSDFLLGADAIYKKPRRKHGISGLRGYQFGVGASVTYRGFGLYGRYSLTPLFDTSEGPECRTFSFGFSWTPGL